MYSPENDADGRQSYTAQLGYGQSDADVAGYRAHPSFATHYGGQDSSIFGSAALSSSQESSYEADDESEFHSVYDCDIHIFDDIFLSDDKSAFVEALKDRLDVRRTTDDQINLLRDKLESLCSTDSVNCASALLEWEINGLKVDLNAPLPGNGYFMHNVANYYSIGMLKLMLQHGASADVRTSKRDPTSKRDTDAVADLLPLNVSLDNLSFHIYLMDWTPKDSIYKLITVLCLPQMKSMLNFIKLLAMNTADTFVELVKYAKEGNVIQMAALLMAARECIVQGPAKACECKDSHDGCKNGLMWIRQYLLKEIGLLHYEEIRMMGDGKSAKKIKKCKDARAAMISSLKLLEVLERAGDAIDEHLQINSKPMVSKEMVAEDVANFLRKAGFHLKEHDSDLSNIEWVELDDDHMVVKDSKGSRSTIGSQSHPHDLELPLQRPDTPSSEEQGCGYFKAAYTRNTFIPVSTPALSSLLGFFGTGVTSEQPILKLSSKFNDYRAMKTGSAMGKNGSQVRRRLHSTFALVARKCVR